MILSFFLSSNWKTNHPYLQTSDLTALGISFHCLSTIHWSALATTILSHCSYGNYFVFLKHQRYLTCQCIPCHNYPIPFHHWWMLNTCTAKAAQRLSTFHLPSVMEFSLTVCWWYTCSKTPFYLFYFIFLKSFFLMWTIFKVFIEFVTTLLLFYVLVFWPWRMWDPSSLTRDQTDTPFIGRWSLNHWTTREVPQNAILECSLGPLLTPFTSSIEDRK